MSEDARNPCHATCSSRPRWWWTALFVVWMLVIRIGEAANPGPGGLDDPEDFADFDVDLEAELAAEAAAERATNSREQEPPQPPGDNTKVGPLPPGGCPLTGGPQGVGPSGAPGGLRREDQWAQQQQQQRPQGSVAAASSGSSHIGSGCTLPDSETSRRAQWALQQAVERVALSSAEPPEPPPAPKQSPPPMAQCRIKLDPTSPRP